MVVKVWILDSVEGGVVNVEKGCWVAEVKLVWRDANDGTVALVQILGRVYELAVSPNLVIRPP